MAWKKKQPEPAEEAQVNTPIEPAAIAYTAVEVFTERLAACLKGHHETDGQTASALPVCKNCRCLYVPQ